MNYKNIGIASRRQMLFKIQNVSPDKSRFKINADFLKVNLNWAGECYRELMVSYIPMLPLLEDTVSFKDADYILYEHPYSRAEDMSWKVIEELNWISENRKEGAEIIVVGKSANAKELLNGSIENITFWGDHFTEKLGKKFGLNIKEQYFVWDDELEQLSIWPVDGCLRKCKFCRRSYMHIRFESLSLDTIKENLDYYKKNEPEKMYRISLRAENLTEYGIDIYGTQKLHELIDLLNSYDEIEEIDIPIGVAICEITPEILDAFCRCKKLVRIALNMEAGSNRLLKLIGKDHTREKVLHVYQKITQAIPDIWIDSMVMIGLPTETLTDIMELADLIEKTQPNWIGCVYYQWAPRQPLAQLPQLSKSLKEYHQEFFLQLLKNQRRDIPLEVKYAKTLKKGRRKTERIKKNLQWYRDEFGLENRIHEFKIFEPNNK